MKSQDSGSAEKKISERLKETKTGKMIVENLEPLDPEQKVVRDSKGDIFTIPNLLTMARIALVNLNAFAEGGGGLEEFFIWKALILAVLIFVGQKKLKWSPVVFIAISAVVGIIFKF